MAETAPQDSENCLVVVVSVQELNQGVMKKIQPPVQHDPTPVSKTVTKTLWQ
jgi:hypothetical protein